MLSVYFFWNGALDFCSEELNFVSFVLHEPKIIKVQGVAGSITL